MPDIADAEPPAKAGWRGASPPAPGLAVSQFDSLDKTESYEVIRHPEGGRKDIFRWVTGQPVAELEIYSQLILLTAGNDAKLAELFARAGLRRGSCAAAASAISPDWVTAAENPLLRGAI